MKINSFKLCLYSIIALTNIYCNDTSSTYVIENLAIDRSMNAKIWYDTTFSKGIFCRIGSFCIDNVAYIDTIKFGKNSFRIQRFHDIEFHVLFAPAWSAQVIDISSFKDSLTADLKQNGILTPPYDLKFNPTDTSISFKTMIRHRDSIDGNIYTLRLKNKVSFNVSTVEAVERK